MRLAMAVAAFLLVLALPVAAGVPDPFRSSYSDCVVICPEGDIPLSVVVRDAAGFPVPGAAVTLTTCPCPEVRFCPLDGTENYSIQNGCVIKGVTDAGGSLVIGIRGGGACVGPVQLHADGILLHTYNSVASTDLDADSYVTAGDRAILLANAGSLDPRYDLDCTPPSDGMDLTVMDNHIGHSCTDGVPAVPGTWGTVKAIYR